MHRTRFIILTLLHALLFLASANAASSQADIHTFHRDVAPLLNKYCISCHGPNKVKGKMRFDIIDPDMISGADSEKWHDTREAFFAGEMPPEEEPQPTSAEREVIANWLDQEIKKAQRLGNPQHHGTIRRLTKYELQYSLEDLLGLAAAKAVEGLPDESPSGETGLENNRQLLQISGIYLDSYIDSVFAGTQGLKDLLNLEPVTTTLSGTDYERLKKDKTRHEVIKATKLQEGNLLIAAGGAIDFAVSPIAACPLTIEVQATASGDGHLTFGYGYKYSKKNRRHILSPLGEIAIGNTNTTYRLLYDPRVTPFKIPIDLDKPYFIRVENTSQTPLLVTTITFTGNISAPIRNDLIGPEATFKPQPLIKDFITKAFRRTPRADEIAKYQARYNEFITTETPAVALLSTYEDILCSPKFLFIGAPSGLSTIDDQNFAIAERLAYFLWCSIPDQALLNDATAGRLTNRAVLTKHIARMLADDRAKRMVSEFTDQWLHTAILSNVAVDNLYYKNFDDALKPLMRQETIESVNDVIRNGAPATDLLQANHVFVNERLANYYGIAGVHGGHFRKVPVSTSHQRGGLLTQATFLIGNSDGINSHAILRGVWLIETILNDPPPAPPNNVPPLDESIPGFNQMTLNQKLFLHRDKNACRSCHEKIDPYGVPFENYDASGSWREKVLVITQDLEKSAQKQKPVYDKSHLAIERTATLATGQTIDGMKALKRFLVAERKDDFARGLTEKLLSFALARDVGFYDETLVDEMLETLQANGYSVPKLIEAIIIHPEFLTGAMQ